MSVRPFTFVMRSFGWSVCRPRLRNAAVTTGDGSDRTNELRRLTLFRGRIVNTGFLLLLRKAPEFSTEASGEKKKRVSFSSSHNSSVRLLIPPSTADQTNLIE
ncbi:hypothetical protein niasHS_011136 [Heterodera schachtii]|uniref:Secreted protein n=1 Tax=Heterodera schachtii TaxID=97005 RepID=A0ABD2ITL8_HETSC